MIGLIITRREHEKGAVPELADAQLVGVLLLLIFAFVSTTALVISLYI
jgi:hypothetical protein